MTDIAFPEVPNGKWDVFLGSRAVLVSLTVTEGGKPQEYKNFLYGRPQSPEKILQAAEDLLSRLPSLRAEAAALRHDRDHLTKVLGVPVSGV